jgi:hypothetical protein
VIDLNGNIEEFPTGIGQLPTRHEAEVVPPAPPGLIDSAALEDDVLHTGLRELAADGQPRRARADYGDSDRLIHVSIFTVRRAKYDSSDV